MFDQIRPKKMGNFFASLRKEHQQKLLTIIKRADILEAKELIAKYCIESGFRRKTIEDMVQELIDAKLVSIETNDENKEILIYNKENGI